MKQVSAKFGAAISLTTLVLIALSSVSIAEEETNSKFSMPSAILAQASIGNTIIILPPIGEGNIDPAPGNYTVPSSRSFTVNAEASGNFYFDLWVISGSNTSGRGIVPTGSGWDNNYTLANPLTIECGQGYTYSLQAIFKEKPNTSADSLPLGLTATATIAFLVSVAIIEAAVLGILYIKKGKK